jgi:hypothetical protein
MAAKLTRLTHKIAIQLHLVAESCSFRSRRPVRKLLDTPSYVITTVPYSIRFLNCLYTEYLQISCKCLVALQRLGLAARHVPKRTPDPLLSPKSKPEGCLTT